MRPHQVPINAMLVFKSLCMNLLKFLILCTLKVVLVGPHIVPITLWNIFRLRLSNSILTKIKILLLFQQPLVSWKKTKLSINTLVMSKFPLQLVFFSPGNHISHTIYTDHIMCVLIHIICSYDQKTNTHQVIYYFNRN